MLLVSGVWRRRGTVGSGGGGCLRKKEGKEEQSGGKENNSKQEIRDVNSNASGCACSTSVRLYADRFIVYNYSRSQSKWLTDTFLVFLPFFWAFE